MSEAKKRDKITIFKDYNENAMRVSEAAAKAGMSKSEYIRRSLMDSLSQEDRIIINLNPELKKAIDDLSDMGPYGERWAYAYLNNDAALSKKIDEEYFKDWHSRGMTGGLLKAACATQRQYSEKLAETIKKQLLVSCAALFVTGLESELAEMRREREVKKKVERGGI